MFKDTLRNTLIDPDMKKRTSNKGAVAVDLFCGAGGLTYGLEQAGINVSEGVDMDPHCAYPFEKNTNAKFVCKDVRKYTASDIKRAWNGADVKILVGCAPCQPFSTYTQGPRGRYRQRWVLLRRFADLVEETKPDIVSMENVTPLEETDMFRRYVSKLSKLGYDIEYGTVDCRTYGAAQMRRRLVLLASRLGEISLKEQTHEDETRWTTVRDTIAHLPPIRAGEICADDPIHRSSKLSEINLKRIKASKPGGTWKDWPEELVADCHLKASGKTYPGVYGRMEWDKPSPTITGQSFGFGNGRFGHPQQNRGLSLREAALLQTFPEDYEFVAPDAPFPGMKHIGRLIGNAVPPMLGQVIGESILDHIERQA